MSPIYHHTATDRNVNLIGHIRVRDESLATLGYLDAIGKVEGLLPDVCYRTLVEQLQAVIYIDTLDESEPALYMSPQVEVMLGYEPEEWLLDPDLWTKLLHAEDKERAFAEAERARRTGGPFQMEYRLRSRDGRIVWVRDEAVKVESQKEGCPTAWQGIMLDITEHKRWEEELKASEKLFRKTFEVAGVGMAHVTPDGRWLRVNDKLCEISGYTREELLGMSYLDLTLSDDVAAGEERVRQLLDGRISSYSVERRYVRKDGSRVWVSLSVSLMRTAFGEPDYIVCVADDVTERKIAELAPDPLTSQELEVLRLMAAGLTNLQVALCLSYSLGGIKHQVQRIIAKLGARNRGEAVARAVNSGLICPSDNTN